MENYLVLNVTCWLIYSGGVANLGDTFFPDSFAQLLWTIQHCFAREWDSPTIQVELTLNDNRPGPIEKYLVTWEVPKGCRKPQAVLAAQVFDDPRLLVPRGPHLKELWKKYQELAKTPFRRIAPLGVTSTEAQL